MNIKFKDSEEYKSLMQDLKKESLKVKNENIHLTALMKHLAKEHKELIIFHLKRPLQIIFMKLLKK